MLVIGEHEEGNLKVAGQLPISPETIIKQWRGMISDCPDYIIQTAKNIIKTSIGPLYSEQSKNIMHKLGYQTGQGLGPRGAGMLVNPEWEREPHKPGEGLGYKANKKRRSAKSRKLIAVPDPATNHRKDPTSGFKYGYVCTKEVEPKLKLVRLTPKGKPRLTGLSVDLFDALGDDPPFNVLTYKGAVLGPAELTYPHPEGWVVNTGNHLTNFDQLNVKSLTAIFRSTFEEPPTCRSSWPKYLKLKLDIPWQAIASLIHSPLTTNRDIHTWFKCILHRGMLVRRIKPCDGNTNCRLCNYHTETIEHFAECSALAETFTPFINLMKELSPRLKVNNVTLLLGCSDHDGSLAPIQPGPFSLLLILWKFIILELTNLDTMGTNFSNARVWRLTCTRIKERMNALEFSYRQRVLAAANKGTVAPKPDKLNARLAPLAELSESGELALNSNFALLIDSHLNGRDTPSLPVTVTKPCCKPIQFVKASS